MQKTGNQSNYEDLVGAGFFKNENPLSGGICCSYREFIEAILFDCCRTLLVQSRCFLNLAGVEFNAC